MLGPHPHPHPKPHPTPTPTLIPTPAPTLTPNQLWFEANCCGATEAAVKARQGRHCIHHSRRGKVCPVTPADADASPGSPQKAVAPQQAPNPCRVGAGAGNPAWEDVWTGYALS